MAGKRTGRIGTPAAGIPAVPVPAAPAFPAAAGAAGPTPAQFDAPGMGTDAGHGQRRQTQCNGCGSTVEAHHRFCPTCGALVAGESATKIPIPEAGPLPTSGARLTSLYPDGTEATAFQLETDTIIVGRNSGGVFSADQYLSPRHASFLLQGTDVVVRDQHSLNGLFRRIVQDERHILAHGQLFRIGQELIRFESLTPTPPDADGVEIMGAPMDGYVGRIVMMEGRATSGTAFPIPESGLSIGRERGEVLFADDGYVSGLHCRLSFERGAVYITDLGSSNGTFVRVDGGGTFHHGDVVLLGQQLFRIDF